MYEILIDQKVVKKLEKLPKEEARNIIKVLTRCLESEPKSPSHQCNKKPLKGSKSHTWRIHISMKYTAFYRIDERNKNVVVIDILGINQAHSKYGLFMIFS